MDCACDAVDGFNEQFDIIVVDGTGKSRPACCEAAIRKLRRGGMIILVDSDLWQKSARILRNSGLIQIDFTGFGPINSHVHSTSIYLDREYAFEPLNDIQPSKSVAQPAEIWPHG